MSVSRALLAAFAISAVSCGGGGSDAVQNPGTTTLATVQAQVFSPRCALSGCHAGMGAPFGLDLSAGLTEGNTVGVASGEAPAFLRVEPGNPDDSYLYMKVTGDARITGDAMPASGGPLSAGQLSLIRAWIEQGAR